MNSNHFDTSLSEQDLQVFMQLQNQTPPGSNKSSSGHCDGDGKRLSGHGTSNMGILRPEELSKMFPTPPSMEHNPIASPCGQTDPPPPDLTDLGIVRVKQEIYPNMGSPQEENIGSTARSGDAARIYVCFPICRRLELRVQAAHDLQDGRLQQVRSPHESTQPEPSAGHSARQLRLPTILGAAAATATAALRDHGKTAPTATSGDPRSTAPEQRQHERLSAESNARIQAAAAAV